GRRLAVETTGGLQTFLLLVITKGGLGLGTHLPVDVARIVTLVLQRLLNGLHLLGVAAHRAASGPAATRGRARLHVAARARGARHRARGAGRAARRVGRRPRAAAGTGGRRGAGAGAGRRG